MSVNSKMTYVFFDMKTILSNTLYYLRSAIEKFIHLTLFYKLFNWNVIWIPTIVFDHFSSLTLDI